MFEGSNIVPEDWMSLESHHFSGIGDILKERAMCWKFKRSVGRSDDMSKMHTICRKLYKCTRCMVDLSRS